MSNTQGNLVNVAAKNQEPQQPVNPNNNIRPEEQTNWVTVDMEDPIAKEEAANFNPLRTAVILGIPDSIAGGDFENAYNVQADLKSDHLIEVTARLDAKAGILPSIENIKRDAEMAREKWKNHTPFKRVQATCFWGLCNKQTTVKYFQILELSQ